MIGSVHGGDFVRAPELCESRGGRPGLPLPDIPYGLCGHKSSLNENAERRSCAKVEVAVLGPPVPNSLYGLCGRKATLNWN